MHILESKHDDMGTLHGKYYKNLTTREKPGTYTAKAYVASTLPLEREGEEAMLTMPGLGVEEELMGEKKFYEGTLETTFTKNMASIVEALERGDMVLLDEKSVDELEEFYKRSEDARVGDNEGGFVEKTLWKGIKKLEEHISGEREMTAYEYFGHVRKNLIPFKTNPNEKMPGMFDLLNDPDMQVKLVERVNAMWQENKKSQKHSTEAKPSGPHIPLKEQRAAKEAAEKKVAEEKKAANVQAVKKVVEQIQTPIKKAMHKILSFFK